MRKIGPSQFVIYHSVCSVAIIPWRCDSIAHRPGALSSGGVQFYGASNRASICCRADYLSAYFFGPRDPVDTWNDRLDHISPTRGKSRTRSFPRSIDRVIGHCVSLICSLDRRGRLIAISLGQRCCDPDLGADSIARLPKFKSLLFCRHTCCHE